VERAKRLRREAKGERVDFKTCFYCKQTKPESSFFVGMTCYRCAEMELKIEKIFFRTIGFSFLLLMLALFLVRYGEFR